MPIAFTIKSFFNSLNSSRSDAIGKTIDHMTSSFKSIPSIISKDSKIEGRIQSSGVVEVEGYIKGSINSNTIVIREGGSIEGEAIADFINIMGNFNGQIKAKNVSVFSKAKINGSIEYEVLSVEDGASIEGQFKQLST